MPRGRGISGFNIFDLASSGFFLFVFLVWDCFGSGCADHRWDRDMRDLLSGGASIRWDRDTVAAVRLPARIRACVSSPVWPGVRRVGEFYAAGISACFVTIAIVIGAGKDQVRKSEKIRPL